MSGCGLSAISITAHPDIRKAKLGAGSSIMNKQGMKDVYRPIQYYRGDRLGMPSLWEPFSSKTEKYDILQRKL